MKLERSYEISLRFKSPNLPLFISILSKVLLSSNLFSFFPSSTRTHHSSPPKKSYRNKFSNIQIWNHIQKERNKWSRFVPLNRRGRKEAREDPNLVVFWRFQAWWPLECLMFGGPWNESSAWKPMGKHID
jgi:hypothetical protein